MRMIQGVEPHNVRDLKAIEAERGQGYKWR